MKQPKKQISMRLTVAEIRAWKAAAERDGRTLNGWLRRVANKAAEAAKR